ncbi:ribosomal protein L1p/L10e family-domain-containing protein [Biscogniauxia sp. FL1348]|nr:ribosomal protein L1p/L10e family-domain-containing protein [Biscogniauxia sp. FL1348]
MAPPSNKTVTLRSETAAVSLVDPDQTLKASRALLSHMQKASKEKAANETKKDLLADPDAEVFETIPIWCTITTKRHITESRSLKPSKIVLPHSLNADAENICVITAEPQRHYKNLVAAAEFPPELRKKITRVIDIGKLKAKHKSYEQQRALYAAHDAFVADSRIISRLPAVLGKTFYKTTAKRPISIEIQARKARVDGKRTSRTKDAEEINACTPVQFAAEIERAVGAALVNLSPTTNTAVRIGYAGWTAEQIAANVDTFVKTLVEKHIPGKWKNMKSVYLKGPETVALPIWQTDELWVEGKDIVADDSEEAKALLPGEKANVGKKRKSLDGTTEDAAPKPKKAKKVAKAVVAAAAPVAATKPESDDSKLDKEIADRKAALKKQKKAAKKALEV